MAASQPLGLDDSPKRVSSTISFGHSSLDIVCLVFSMERFKKMFITEAQRTRMFYWFSAYSMEDGQPCTVHTVATTGAVTPVTSKVITVSPTAFPPCRPLSMELTLSLLVGCLR